MTALRALAVIALTFSAIGVSAQEMPAPFAALIEENRAFCASFDNGELTVPFDAVTQTDLTGNGEVDYVLDDGKLRCSTAATLWCGTGGCSVHFLVGDKITQRLSKGWEVERFGFLTVVLNQIHGVNCGGTNIMPCVEAMVWDESEGRFATLAE